MKCSNNVNLVMKLSDEQIHDIADTVDALNNICYINSDTGEYVLMMNNEMLSEYGISWDYDEEPDEDRPEWLMDMYSETKSDMAKIDSWEHVIRIEKPESFEAFEFMERFVEEIIPEGKLQNDFCRALSRSHPFRNFNAIVHNCEYREDWFKFKRLMLEKHVRAALGDYGECET